MPENKQIQPANTRPRRLRILCLILLAVLCAAASACFFFSRSVPFGGGSFPEDDGRMEADFERLRTETYEGVLLSMHSSEVFSEEDFAFFRGQKVVTASHSILNTKELAGYFDCIFRSGRTLDSLYLCLDPALLWTMADEKASKWEESLKDGLYTYIAGHPSVAFEVLLPYPYISYWLDMEPDDFDTLLTVYHTLVNELSAYPNARIFFPGIEEWLMVNPANYTDSLFDANEIITNKVFLYTFCDAAYQITPENESFFWDSLRETVSRERTAPTHYPDLSDWCLVFFGDSVLGNFPGSFSIPGYVSGLSGAAVYNYAIGGASAAFYEDGIRNFASMSSGFIAENVTATENGYAFTPGGTAEEALEGKKLCFVINYGFNDYFNGALIENFHKLDDITTFKGSLRNGISTLKAAFPDARYLIVTPTHTALFENGSAVTSEKGGILPAYIDAAREIASEMQLYFLDNYNDFVITADTLDTYLSDGVHPNELGRLTLAKRLMYFIEEEVR